MKVKTRLKVPIVSQLSDWELISAYSYCKRLLNPRSLLDHVDFEDICVIFFENDPVVTRCVLETIQKLYAEEYSKRHIN